MKDVSSIKSSIKDSPKTPGGISKSLLTPCRRVGLSRKFRKSGASPFQSPLSADPEVKHEKSGPRKRKESLEESSQTSENDSGSTSKTIETPTRNVDIPRRKKSKTLLVSIKKATEDNGLPISIQVNNGSTLDDKPVPEVSCEGNNNMKENNMELVSTPVRLKSKSRSKKKISPLTSIKKENFDLKQENSRNFAVNEPCNNPDISNKVTKQNSPNNLTKECIVVIQKKIFTKELRDKPTTPKSKKHAVKLKDSSQALFDSDSDDVPLNMLHNKETIQPLEPEVVDDDDDDFTTKPQITKLDKTTKIISKSPANKNKKNLHVTNGEVHKPNVKVDIHKSMNSQSSVDDDDDFFEKKKTILVRKSYDKVLKPQKAKSTGSITQKDIDDLKAKIDIKRKMLLARGMMEDTKELRDLIKKWQKGCQDALMELMDLMKNKFPDKQNMDYPHMLQTLKIPASLVGYDSDNDCFLTPEDETIILGNLKE